ncbi:MAG: hypothetical protein JSU63_06440 [Phycisphaerales bacterium]|nr:MAG: hypothetical protein JSU63_06440 [Phycisphaerales bacterium]
MFEAKATGRRLRAARRRKVRIVKRQRLTRAAAVSLLAVAIPAGVLFLAWRFWQEDEALVINTRAITDVVVDWKCDSGHGFVAKGQSEPKRCPTCGRPAYPVGVYHCPVHGSFEVTVRYEKTEDGGSRPSHYRVGGREWVRVEKGVRCPRCKKELQRRPRDPFAPEERKRERSER